MVRNRLLSSRLVRCDAGVTAIEFALLSPILFLLTMAIIEFSVIMFVSVVLENATDMTARLGSTGYVPAGESQSAEIIANVDTMTAGLLDPAKLTVTTTSYSAGASDSGFTEVGVAGDGTAASLGGAGDVVVYTVSYPWTVMTPIVNAVIGNTITLKASTVIRNEPY